VAKSQQNSRRQRDSNSYSRRPANTEQQKRFLIVCEGETEQIYFEYLSHEYNKLQAVIVIKCSHGGTPDRAIKLAVTERNRLKADDNSYDQVWCVFDTEASTNKNVFDEAIRIAREEKLSLAISNPCFEYWFILHYEQTNVSLANCEDASKKLKRKLLTYNKKQAALKALLPREILPQTKDAIQNAKACMLGMKQTNREEFPNPSTTVYELVEELIKLTQNKPY
jgi:hypothetical protein